jgi:hypothetical protein
MSEQDKLERARRILAGAGDGAASMSTDRPLDALLPELKRARQLDLPKLPFHPRVLEVEMEDGIEWVMACWSDPGNVREFHKQLLALLEATLIAELSQAAKHVATRERPRHFAGVRLMVFPQLPYSVGPAVQAFGFSQQDYRPDQYMARMAALEDEARITGVDMPKTPASVWMTRISRPTGTQGETLYVLERSLSLAMKDQVWGQDPGQMSRLFATLAMEHFGVEIRPEPVGLDRMEQLLTRREFGVIRWMPPLLFQALCDLIGVVAKMHFGAEVAWAVCEEDRGGMAPPPVFQVKESATRKYHVPIAHHVLRWCMMPLAPNEQVPPLSAWMVDQFAKN